MPISKKEMLEQKKLFIALDENSRSGFKKELENNISDVLLLAKDSSLETLKEKLTPELYEFTKIVKKADDEGMLPGRSYNLAKFVQRELKIARKKASGFGVHY